MKTKKLSTKQLTVLGLMIAVLVLMSYTPLGYLNIGPLAITFNMIPVAIAAISCGPLGGAVLLTPPVIALGGEIHSNSESVTQQQNENCFQAVLAERDMKRAAHRRPKVSDQPGETILHKRCDPQRQPHDGDRAEAVQEDILLGEFIVPHGLPSFAPFEAQRQ